MLACRVPYFATLLFGGFAENLTQETIPLKFCDSSTFREILKFVWDAEISMSNMNIKQLLDLLETSRFLCIERLTDAIIEYFEYLLNRNEVDCKDCLVAFQFMEDNKFMRASEIFLNFIDKNMSSVSPCDIGILSENSIKKLIRYEKRTSSEIERFIVFENWLNCQDTQLVYEKRELMEWFDLRQFDDCDLMKTVRQSNLFDEKDICDVLGEKLEAQKQEKEQLEKEREQMIKESQVIKFNVGGFAQSQINARNQFLLPSQFHTHFINNVEFALGFKCHKYSYTLQCSQDGVVWTDILQCNDVCGGFQHLSFERRKMRFIGVKLTNGYYPLTGHLHPNPCIQNLTAGMV